MNKLNKKIPLGQILKPHGIKGELKILFYNEESNSLKNNQVVFLGSKEGVFCEYKIERILYSFRKNRVKFFDINTIDNNGENVSITMTSNRSDGWIRESEDRLFFAEFWPQTNDINGMHMSTEERHREREPAKRWVHLSISDSVGNSIEKILLPKKP